MVIPGFDSRGLATILSSQQKKQKMRKITVMFIMLLGGIINAQTFDFGCTAPLTGADADNSLYAQTQAEADALTAGERRTSRSDEFNALGTPSDLDIELKWITLSDPFSQSVPTHSVWVTILKFGNTQPYRFFAVNHVSGKTHGAMDDMTVEEFNSYYTEVWEYINTYY